MQREKTLVSLHDLRRKKLKKEHHKSSLHFRGLKYDTVIKTKLELYKWYNYNYIVFNERIGYASSFTYIERKEPK